jgi:hypothetical protein
MSDHTIVLVILAILAIYVICQEIDKARGVK